MRNFLPPLATAWPAVSLFLPVSGSATAADAARLTRALDKTAARLEALVGRREAAAMLDPARDLFDRPGFGDRAHGGVALFLSPGQFKPVALPFAPPELSVIGRWFHIRPLLPLLAGDGRFWILALAAGRVQLFAADRDGITPIEVPDLPTSVAEVSAETDATEGVQFNPVARPHLNRGAPGVVKSHGLESPEEVRKAEFIEFLRRVNHAVVDALASSNAPLVLAAEPEALGHFRGLCSYRDVHPEAIDGNPFAIDWTTLHHRGYALLRDRFSAPIGALKDRVAARLGTAEPTVTLKLDEILSAAAVSRVDGLLLADDATLWGHFDPDKGLLSVHGTPESADEDLFNIAAVQTLAHGGDVYMLPAGEMPHGALAAAALRY